MFRLLNPFFWLKMIFISIVLISLFAVNSGGVGSKINKKDGLRGMVIEACDSASEVLGDVQTSLDAQVKEDLAEIKRRTDTSKIEKGNDFHRLKLIIFDE